MYPERRVHSVASELDGRSYSRIQNVKNEEQFLDAADAQALFERTWGSYNEVFRDKLGFSGRNYLSELMEVRNSWAHGGPFTVEETSRALDTMHLLLRAVSAGPEAEEIGRHHRAVMREIFEADQRREVRRVTREAPETPGGLLPWRRIVDLHPDVQEGRYQEAEFAADLAEVHHGDADRNGTAPGAGTLKRLFDEFGPALVLVDELVAYVRNIYGNDGLLAGSFDSNMTFVQNLTEAAKRSERSMVVVSIPVSERAEESGRSEIELGGEVGKLVAERLEQVIGRLESVWKPVGALEGFEIARRGGLGLRPHVPREPQRVPFGVR